MAKRTKKKMCLICGIRKSKFKYNGKIKSDKHHDLCIRCFRSTMSRFEFTANTRPIPENFIVRTSRIKTT